MGAETELQCAAGPRNHWRIGSYEFERYARDQGAPGSRRWGCCWRNSRGVENCRSPLGAFLALRRVLRNDP